MFNRKHFHATPAGVSCILWHNDKPQASNQIILKAYDLTDYNQLNYVKDINIKHVVHNFSSTLYDKRTFANDKTDGICCNLDGTERTNERTIRVKKLYNSNIIGYIRASSFNFDALSHQLLRAGEYDANGFFVRKDNYLTKLPLWVAKLIPLQNWYEKEIYATTADDSTVYTKDKAFLQHCLLYTCLSNQNKCLSFTGSDKRYYRNELCFDDTNGATQAISDLDQSSLSKQEQNLLDLWNNILQEAKKTANYDSKLTYGVYQITKELNTFHQVGTGTRKKKIADYPTLNGYLVSLRDNLKQYYLETIKPDMFIYELVK